MEYLTKDDIVWINSKTIQKHGGNFIPPFNFLHESSLDYLIDIVRAEAFGQSLYPGLSDKAGLYMFSIINNHVFSDGNKRTGLASALLFLRINGFQLKESLVNIVLNDHSIPETGITSKKLLFEFTMEVAAAKVSLRGCQQWLEKNVEAIT